MANVKDGAVTLTGKPGRGYEAEQGRVSFPSQRASYTPSAAVDPHSYGKDGGKAAAQGRDVPQVVAGGASETAPLPRMPGGDFTVGDDKNVSTPVTG